jgi:hypothetical protein
MLPQNFYLFIYLFIFIILFFTKENKESGGIFGNMLAVEMESQN